MGGRSALGALLEIKRMRGISWIIEGSLELKDFSSNDYQRLAQIFIKYINPDQTFKDFCIKFCQVASVRPPLKQGYQFSPRQLSGITPPPIGGVLSPFVHLLFKPFDEYLDKLKKELENVPVSIDYPSGGRNISFVRYGDKFLVGVSGSYKDTFLIRHLLNNFFYKELGWSIRTDKVNIIHLSSHYVEFLGYSITTEFPSNSHQSASLGSSIQSLRVRQDANSTSKNIFPCGGSDRRLKLIVNKKAIKEWLILEGLANEEGKPCYVGKWIYLSDGEIINCFNRILTRLKNYYRGFYNRGQLHEAGYIIKFSLLHTLAIKHRMSLNKVAKYTVDKVKLINYIRP